MYTHAVWVAALFRDDTDRMSFKRRLARTTAEVGWTCIAYCLMTTHHHLLLKVDDGVLPRGMHKLNLGYARDYNTRYSLRGHVQFSRYGAKRVSGNANLLRAYKYIVMNPVQAGLVAHPAEWQWSSYAGSAGIHEADSFVDVTPMLDVFEQPPELAIAALRAYVEKS